MTSPSPANVMSVDVEDYFQVWALSEVISRDQWDDFPLRVAENTARIMDLFARHNVRATFFTLGWVAEKCPEVVRQIHDAGHEVASHGYEHVKVFDQTKDQFFEDIVKTKKILEDLTGAPVNGYRAAGFSLDNRSPWAYDKLVEAGYSYSSSLHPIAHDHYSMPNAPRFSFHPIESHAFLEIPVTTTSIAGRRISCAGGGWFRALPYPLFSRMLRKVRQQDQQSLVFYFHPWEIDPDQPGVDGLSGKARLRHYVNLSQMEKKLEKLCAEYTWSRMDEVFDIASLQRAA